MSTGRLGAGDTAIQPTIFDAKGDLIVATAADTPARLAVGTNGQALLADSTTATGLKWGAVGKVLQVVQSAYSTGSLTTSTTYSDTGLTASITPSSASSKILLFVAQTFDNTTGTGSIQILRGATVLFLPWGNALRGSGVFNYSYLDSPATTSSTTYKTQFRASSSTLYTQSDGSQSTLILMEIGA